MPALTTEGGRHPYEGYGTAELEVLVPSPGLPPIGARVRLRVARLRQQQTDGRRRRKLAGALQRRLRADASTGSLLTTHTKDMVTVAQLQVPAAEGVEAASQVPTQSAPDVARGPSNGE